MALDTTFGQNKKGWTLTDNFYTAYSQVTDTKNRTIVVGQTGSEATKKNTLFISRYTSSGLLDTNFGQGGYVYGDYYTGKGSAGYGIVLDENQNILVTGKATDDNDIERLLIAKYSSEGVKDPFFGGGKGWETYTFDYPKIGSAGGDITLDSSGLILVGGNLRGVDTSTSFILSRYEKDGTLDKNFGGNATGWYIFDVPGSSLYYSLKFLVEPPKGSILYLVQAGAGGPIYSPDLIYKFTSDGILDKNFGGQQGYIVVKNGSNFVAYSDGISAITLDQSGNILYTSNNYYDNNLLLVRYTSNGDLDANFGENKGYTITEISNYQSTAQSLILDSNNRILVSGFIRDTENTNQILLARYTSNGILDPTFGDNGLGYTIFKGVDVSTPSQTNSISLDNNGRVVITGNGGIINVSAGTLIIRYLNESSGTTTTTEPICLPAGTPILTDQGIVPIEKIDPKKHTIGKKRIVAITTTITPEKHLVCFEANSMGINCPTVRTIMTPGHEVLYKGKLVQAKHFVGRVEGVHTVPYNGKDVLYNVLQEQHGLMRVNGMVLETLHPENKVARLILGNQ
jgi:uncharacterized delta-60 repeat protein